jgi:hypothetical protein
LKDGLMIYLPALLLLSLLDQWPLKTEKRLFIFLYLAGVGFVTIMVAAIASGNIRSRMRGVFKRVQLKDTLPE